MNGFSTPYPSSTSARQSAAPQRQDSDVAGQETSCWLIVTCVSPVRGILSRCRQFPKLGVPTCGDSSRMSSVIWWHSRTGRTRDPSCGFA